MTNRLIHAALCFAALFAAGCGREQLELARGVCDYGQVEVGNTCVVVVGRPCDRDGSCMGGSCILDGDQRYCTTECAADDECPASHLCTTAGDRRYCRKDHGVLPGRCRADVDCPRCAICTEGFCRPSQVCVELICSSDDECGRCRTCRAGACTAIADCGPACVSSFDCLPEEVCTYDYQGGLACLPRTGGAFSAPCSIQTGLQCESNVCLYAEGVGTVYDTYCSMRCIDTKHASDCPPGFRCRDYPPFGDGESYCVLPDGDFPEKCASDDRCPADLACRYGVSIDQKRVVTYCADGVPDGRGLGRSCSAELPCRTGVCPSSGLCTEACETDNDCPEAYFCSPLASAQFEGIQMAFKGCLYYTHLKADLGDFCPGGNDDCESGMCNTGDGGGPIPRCTIPCTETSPPCPQYFACAPLADGTSACQYDVYQGACSADADCGTGEACASDDASGSRFPACRPVKGDEGRPGEPCVAGTSLSCTSGLCLNDGLCSAFCRTGVDCPQGYLCDFGSINPGSGGEFIIIKGCIHEPGSMLFCAHDAGCPDSDEVCRAFIWSRTGEVRSWCRTLRPDWALDGAPCGENAECASGVCLGNAACTSLCAADTDCGPDEVCGTVAHYDTEASARPARACRPKPPASPDPLQTGQPCASDSECLSGTCATDLPGSAFCYDRCRDNYDCLDSYTICRIEPGHGNICTPADYRPVE